MNTLMATLFGLLILLLPNAAVFSHEGCQDCPHKTGESQASITKPSCGHLDEHSKPKDEEQACCCGGQHEGPESSDAHSGANSDAGASAASATPSAISSANTSANISDKSVANWDASYQTGYEPNQQLVNDQLRALASMPEPTENYLEYLSLLDAGGKYAQFESLIKKYISKYPNEKRAVFLLAIHMQRVKKVDVALYLYRQLEKDEHFEKSYLYNQLGLISYHEKNQKNHRAAIESFQKGCEALPEIAEPCVNLGALYMKSHSFAKAESVFRKAYQRNEDLEDAVLGLGSSLEGQGKYKEAHEFYAEFMKDHADSISVVYNDAVVLGNQLKNREQAAELMLRYIQRGGKETAKAHEIIQNWR